MRLELAPLCRGIHDVVAGADATILEDKIADDEGEDDEKATNQQGSARPVRLQMVFCCHSSRSQLSQKAYVTRPSGPTEVCHITDLRLRTPPLQLCGCPCRTRRASALATNEAGSAGHRGARKARARAGRVRKRAA